MPGGDGPAPLRRRAVLQSMGAGVAGVAVTSDRVQGSESNGERSRRVPDVRVYDVSGSASSVHVEIRRRPRSANETVFSEDVELEPRGSRSYRRAFSRSERHEASVVLDGEQRRVADVTDVARNVSRAGVAVKVGPTGSLSVSSVHVDVPRGRN